VLLVAVHHTKVPAQGHVAAAVTAALREPVQAQLRALDPAQVRARRAGLLAPPPFRAAPAALVLRRRPARVVVARGRARGVPRVPRQQMLQPGQLAGQGLVGLQQLRELPSLPADLPGLIAHDDDQLFARELLRDRHTKI